MPLSVLPDADGIYNLSKLTGEALCIAQPSRRIRVARLANVYGDAQNKETFLGSLLNDVSLGRDSIIRESPNSSKDYISLKDVCYILELIATQGKQRLYNVASGEPLCHASLAESLSMLSGRSVTFANEAPHRSFPRIDITRITEEFNFKPQRLLDELKQLVCCYSTHK